MIVPHDRSPPPLVPILVADDAGRGDPRRLLAGLPTELDSAASRLPRTKGAWEDPVDYDSATWHEPLPPWPLGLFGEKGETWVGVPLGVSPEEEGRVMRLFPEANGRGIPVAR